MYRLFAIIVTAYLTLATVAAQTRDAGEVREASAAPAIQAATVMVEGLSADDMLNVRATASPIGKVLDRIPNGTLLRRLECEKVSGYEWCRVGGLEDTSLNGWTPARYLRTIEIEDRVTAAIDPAEVSGEAATTAVSETPADKAKSSALEERFAGATAAPLREATDARLAQLKQRAEAAQAGLDGTGPLLAAEGNSAPSSSSVPIPTPRPGRAEDIAANEQPAEVHVASRLETVPEVASPALLQPAPAEAPAPETAAVTAPDPAALETASQAQPEAQEEAVEVSGIPVPSPRPGTAWSFPATQATGELTGAPAGEVTEIALAKDASEIAQPKAAPVQRQPEMRAQPPMEVAFAAPILRQSSMSVARQVMPAQSEPAPRQTPAPAGVAGEIPCARYVGQPMTRCSVTTSHIGDGSADLAIYWPDGGTRVIEFRDGQPSAANSRGEFRFTREGNLNLIRIGLSERFEITDSVVFGD